MLLIIIIITAVNNMTTTNVQYVEDSLIFIVLTVKEVAKSGYVLIIGEIIIVEPGAIKSNFNNLKMASKAQAQRSDSPNTQMMQRLNADAREY
jgi:hypothetical protein